MDATTSSTDAAWVPAACTLPTAEQPLRSAEFDDLFARRVREVRREGRHRLTLVLDPDPDAAATAAGLAVRETGCCAFFAFDLRIAHEGVALSVTAEPAHAGVLAALADRAEALAGAAR